MSKPNGPPGGPSVNDKQQKTDVKERMAVLYITVRSSVEYTSENGKHKYMNAITKITEALANNVNQVVGYRVEGAAQMTCTQVENGSEDPNNDHLWLFCMTQTMVPS